MKKRQNNTSHKNVPTYSYVFPQDEMRATIDIAAFGMTKALEDYKTLSCVAKENIEKYIIQTCKDLEKMPHFTNDHATYLKIAKQWYTYGYMTMQTMYQKDEEAYRVERMKFEEWGWDVCYQFAHKKILENVIARGVKWQI